MTQVPEADTIVETIVWLALVAERNPRVIGMLWLMAAHWPAAGKSSVVPLFPTTRAQVALKVKLSAPGAEAVRVHPGEAYGVKSV